MIQSVNMTFKEIVFKNKCGNKSAKLDAGLETTQKLAKTLLKVNYRKVKEICSFLYFVVKGFWFITFFVCGFEIKIKCEFF
jgi:hypothetical protein